MSKEIDLKKMVLLAAYSELMLGLLADLEQYPEIWKHKLKQTGNVFAGNLNNFLSKAYGARMKPDEIVYDSEGKEICTAEELQKEFWKLVGMIEQENRKAINEFINDTNNGS